MDVTTYYPGGYQQGRPNGNVAERLVDHGDGTGTRTLYGPDGTVTSTEEVDGLPLPEPVGDDTRAKADAARAAVAGLSQSGATRRAVEALADAIDPPT